MIRIDGRIDGELKTAPLWAQAMLVMLAEAIGPERTREAIDRLSIQNADYSLQVAGKPIITFVGLNRASLVRMGLDEGQIAEVVDGMRAIGRDVTDFLPPAPPIAEPVIVKPSPAPTKPAEGASTNATTPTTTPTGEGSTQPPPPEPQKIAGHLVSELAGKPYKELVAIEGINPKTASKLHKLEPGTATLPE